MELIALALTALCCFFGSVVVVLAAVLWIRHAQARDEAAAKSEGMPSTPAPVSSSASPTRGGKAKRRRGNRWVTLGE